ncbi:tRNA (adenosine(37)-N6)-threonylcarbamoyltransferase complex ATPase subunit type 1 TsaE [Flavobacteriales bacterium]|nr:tRNA (adenosine(37)-N6)-threonylcarbamoyltransferase complex ATPase subunit type 1 TsaE [Flavobacteriales bacterium]
MELTYNVSDESQLNDIALELLNKFDSKLYLFYGKMGVGKTTFIKKFCDKLGVKDIVSSPTFSIINQYKSISEIDVFHFDFYRTTCKEEIFDIGYEEYIYSSSYCFIEWSERLMDLLPTNYIKIEIFLNNNKRTIKVKKVIK